ncbi:hypothetical protein [Erythrobacter sp. R86502]|uniref:hypothetical protein n=1 Tax=Erythrobacter sp. R86502 TaxID=3093846 RepID=UPI0036D38DA4
MANRKLDMGMAWTQATGVIGANRDLVSVLAGIFLFIPFFVLILALFGSDVDFGNAGSEPDPERIAAQLNAVLMANWWAVLLVALGQLAGGAAILALLGDRSRPTVGAVLKRVPRLLLPLFGAQVLVGLVTQLPSFLTGLLPETAAAFAGFVVLPVTLYLTVKYFLTNAVIVLGESRNPIAAMRQSWRLTKANSFRLLAFFLMLTLLALVIGLIMAMIIGLVLSALGEQVALIGNAAFAAAMVSTFYTLSYALTVSIYRQLSDSVPPADLDLFA